MCCLPHSSYLLSPVYANLPSFDKTALNSVLSLHCMAQSPPATRSSAAHPQVAPPANSTLALWTWPINLRPSRPSRPSTPSTPRPSFFIVFHLIGWYRIDIECLNRKLAFMHLLFPALTGRIFFETVCSVICIPPVSVICSWRTLFQEWTWFILSLQGRQWATVYVPGLFPRPWIEPLLNTDQHSEIVLGCRLWPSTIFINILHCTYFQPLSYHLYEYHVCSLYI